MSCCFAGIYRNTIPLVTCSTENGNWDRVFLNMSDHGQIKEGIQVMNVSGFLWGILREQEGLTFLIVNRSIDQKTTEEALKQLKSIFIRTGLNWRTAEQLELMSQFEGKLTEFMKTVSTQGKLATIKDNVADTTASMTSTYEELLLRGTHLDNVTSLSDQLETNTTMYVEEARDLKKKLMWRKYRRYAFWIVIALIALYFLLVLICGGFDLRPRCVSAKPTPEPEGLGIINLD